MSLLLQFQNHLATTNHFGLDDRLLLAISGGLDSVVLLDLLLESGFRPALAHCNFQLRATAAKEDADFVEALARTHGLSYHGKVFATAVYAQANGLSTQMAARELRYAWFDQLVVESGYDYVLTAHHFDDNLETFLLHFLRGTGLKGLAGIPPIRDPYRRPLLFASRAELAAYQQARGLTYRVDESNAEDAYQRNYLRHHVLPHLYQLQPQLPAVGVDNFVRLRQAKDLLRTHIQTLKEQWWTEDDHQGYQLVRPAIEAHPQADLLLWEWLQPLGFSAEQIRQLRSSVTGTVLRTTAWELLVAADHWLVRPVAAPAIADWSVSWPATQAAIILPTGQRLRRTPSVEQPPAWPTDTRMRVYVAAAELHYPLWLRYRQPGDIFYPFGLNGKRQKLKDFFVNQKIDRWQRARTPLLINGDGRLIWVVGHRLDERFRVVKGKEMVCFDLGTEKIMGLGQADLTLKS